MDKTLFDICYVMAFNNSFVCVPQNSTLLHHKCTTDFAQRFDCLPQNNRNEWSDSHAKKECHKMGCCWNLNGTQIDPLIPKCFYPVGYRTYKVSEVSSDKRARNEITAVLKRNHPPPWPPKQTSQLKLVATNINCNILRVKIQDANTSNAEFEPQIILENPLPYKNEEANYEFDFFKDSKDNIKDDPFGFVVKRKNGSTLFNTSISTFVYAEKLKIISAYLPTKHLYGIGEHRDRLYRGADRWRLYTLFNRGNSPGRTSPSVNHYGSHPFILALDNGTAFGIYFHNVNAMDILIQPAPAITFRTVGGVLDFFFLVGPTPTDVISQYTSIIGRPFLIPQYALRFQLSRFGYFYTDVLNNTLQNINAGVPVELQWVDIDYMKDDMQNYRIFTLNKQFESLPQLVKQIHESNRGFVINISPSLSSQEPVRTYPPYEEAVKQNILVMNPKTGQHFVGSVWQNKSVYIDFTNPKTTNYWNKNIEEFLKIIAADALWIDMNEPFSYNSGYESWKKGELNCDKNDPYENIPYYAGGESLSNQTLCMYAQFNAGVHYGIHNLYGMYESQNTFKALETIHRNDRPWVISRATVPGQGRWASHSTGAIQSDWEALRYSIPQILNFNLFGIPLVGADICGFKGNTTPNLCQRWHQLGAFYPFARNHNNWNTIAQDPAALGGDVLEAAIESLIIRYQFLPYLYTLFYKAHLLGHTVARPLFFEFPNDNVTYKIDEQFLLGEAILISPVLYENQSSVTAYFPEGMWLSKFAEPINGPTNFEISANEIKPNIALRSGYIIPVQDFAATITEQRMNPFDLLVLISPKTSTAKGELFWDDGISSNALYNHIEFEAYFNEGTWKGQLVTKAIQIGDKTQSMQFGQIYIYNEFFDSMEPYYVAVNGKEITNVDIEDWTTPDAKYPLGATRLHINLTPNDISLLSESNVFEWEL